MDMTPQAWPEWYDGRHINEVLFCQQFLDKHPMKCVRGRLFTVDGQRRRIRLQLDAGQQIRHDFGQSGGQNSGDFLQNEIADLPLVLYQPVYRERAEVVQHQMEDGKLDRLRRRLEEIHKEELEDGNDTAGVA